MVQVLQVEVAISCNFLRVVAGFDVELGHQMHMLNIFVNPYSFGSQFQPVFRMEFEHFHKIPFKFIQELDAR